MTTSMIPSPLAVIFDMDGLLFDTESLYLTALVDLACELGCECINEDTARSTIGLSWAATRMLLADLLPKSVTVEVFESRWLATFEHMTLERLQVKPGAPELLIHLKDKGVPCALATGSMKETAMSHLARHGLLDFFSVIVTAEDCATGKPSPEPFLEAARRLRIDPADCMALEDSINGVLSAHRAGMTTVMVPDLIEPDSATIGLCAYVAKSLLDVRDLLNHIQNAR